MPDDRFSVRLFRWVYSRFSSPDLQEFESEAVETFADRIEESNTQLGSAAVLMSEILNVIVTRLRRPASLRNRARPSELFGRAIQMMRYTIRTLTRNPLFATVTTVTLALGIGLNTMMFSVVHGVLLSGLPYPDQDRVVVVTNAWEEGRIGLSEKETLRYRALDDVFERVGVYGFGSVTFSGSEAAELVVNAAIDHHVLPALGVSPMLGRNFAPEEDAAGGPNAVILSHALWSAIYGGDSSVVGSSIILDRQSFDVVGVMPAGFRLPLDFVGTPVSVYTPLALDAVPDERNLHYLNGVARLGDGVAVDAAEGRIASTARALIEEFGTLPESFTARLIPVREEVVGEARPALLLLLTAVGLVLLIACVNVANLMLARADQRQQELAVRRALGARRSSLIAVVLWEVGVLAVLGASVGLVGAYWGVDLLVAMAPEGVPRIDAISIDFTVLAYSGMVMLLATLIFGLAPAVRAARTATEGFAQAARGGTAGIGRQRGRRALLVAEIALAVALTVGAGLTIKSFRTLTSVDPGFDESSVLTMQINLPESVYQDSRSARDFYSRLLSEVRALPGVTAAGATRALPLQSAVGDWGVRIRGRGPEGLGERGTPADWHVVTDGFFESLSIPLLEGRYLEGSDRSGTLNAVVINEAMADAYWADGNALGAQFRMSTDIDTIWRTVVGIVADVKQDGLEQVVPPSMYLPHSQFPSTADFPVGGMTLVARAAGDPTRLTAAIREEIRQLDSQIPVSAVGTMESVVSRSTAEQRFRGVLIGTFALAALLLVSVGIYGVTSYLVGQRMRELGIRIALGATRGRILRLIVGEAAALAAVGIGLGILGAVALGRAMATLLYGVSSFDAAVYLMVIGGLGWTVLAAAYLPARRATRVDSVEVLRAE